MFQGIRKPEAIPQVCPIGDQQETRGGEGKHARKVDDRWRKLGIKRRDVDDACNDRAKWNEWHGSELHIADNDTQTSKTVHGCYQPADTNTDTTVTVECS